MPATDDDNDQHALAEAFERALRTDMELAQGLTDWLSGCVAAARKHGLDPSKVIVSQISSAVVSIRAHVPVDVTLATVAALVDVRLQMHAAGQMPSFLVHEKPQKDAS